MAGTCGWQHYLTLVCLHVHLTRLKLVGACNYAYQSMPTRLDLSEYLGTIPLSFWILLEPSLELSDELSSQSSQMPRCPVGFRHFQH